MSKQPNENKRTGKRLFSFVMVLFVLALGIGIGTLISSRVDATGPGDSQLQMQSDGKPVAGGAILALSKAFEEAAMRIEPSVVNINTEELVTDRRQGQPDRIPRIRWVSSTGAFSDVPSRRCLKNKCGAVWDRESLSIRKGTS